MAPVRSTYTFSRIIQDNTGRFSFTITEFPKNGDPIIKQFTTDQDRRGLYRVEGDTLTQMADQETVDLNGVNDKRGAIAYWFFGTGEDGKGAKEDYFEWLEWEGKQNSKTSAKEFLKARKA